MADQTTTERFIADTSAYVRRVEEAAREADAFGRSNSEAALAARRMGVNASEAAERAGRAMRQAADAAERLAREEIGADEAARAAARGARELERADIAAANAARAAARATNQLADEQRAAARAAVEAAALQRLAALRAQGDIRGHNLLLTHLRANYNGAGRDIREMSNLAGRAFNAMQRSGSAAFNQLSNGADKFAQSGPLMIVGVVAALAAIPTVAAVAAGAITLGLGGALAAVGIMAVAKSKDVRESWAAVAADAKTSAAKWAAPFKPVLVGIAGDFQTMIESFGPTMEGAFGNIAGPLRRFGREFADSLLELRPAITTVSQSFGVLLDKLGPELPGIMANIGTGIQSIAQAAADHADEIVQFAMAIGTMVNWTGKFIEVAANIGPYVSLVSSVLAAAGAGGSKAADGLTAANIAAGSAGAAFGSLGSQAATAAMSTKALDDALNQFLNPSLAAYNAATQLAEGHGILSAALKKAHGSLSDNTAASRAARTAFSSQISTVASLGQATQKLTGDNNRARMEVLKSLPELYNAAGANKAARAQVDALAKSFGINARSASSAKSEISSLRGQISALRSKQVTITTIQRTFHVDVSTREKVHASGGYIDYDTRKRGRGYDTGGLVHGPGTGTSDDVPAPWLSTGEYVVKASTTSANRAALDAANYFGAQLVAVSKSSVWGKASIASDPWGKATVFGNNPDPRPRTVVKPPPRMPPHHGLQSYGSAAGQQQQVVNNFYVQGSVVTENELGRLVQTKVLQNGLTLTRPAGF